MLGTHLLRPREIRSDFAPNEAQHGKPPVPSRRSLLGCVDRERHRIPIRNLALDQQNWSSSAEEQELSWGERAGRANSRFGRFFVADEFKSLRRLLFGALVGVIGSFGLLLLLIAVIGKRSAGG
jgi:hypothetical protein